MRLLQPGLGYAGQRERFRWSIPERFNVGTDCLDRHARARPDGLALIHEQAGGAVRTYTFAELRRLANRLANVLAAKGIGRGDRVGIYLGQRPETAVAHLAVYRMGAVALPLFTLFGPEALRFRIGDCGARLVITDGANLPKLAEVRGDLPDLATVIVIEPEDDAGDGDFHALLERASDRFTPVDTAAEEPFLVIYTSGTTGSPKGALMAHRGFLGHLPGIEATHDFFPQVGDLFWTPADWAWGGGLLDVLLPSLHYGVPVVAYRPAKFDPDDAFRLMAKHNVRNSFLPPTVLKMMRRASGDRPPAGVALRSVATGGETLGAELIEWGRGVLGLTLNEFWGQTETNLLAGNSGTMMEVRIGSLGRAFPGHEVDVVDAAGNPVPPGTEGILAARRPDPVFMLGYWNRPEATAEKFVGDWWMTGDIGVKDADGYLFFVGRDDDVISSGAYRIGPGEIEDCLIGHPAVANAAVIGAPDPVRGEIVKAFVVLGPGHAGDAAMTRAIQAHVRDRLAAHQYPRAVEFVAELPMTITGKVRRRDLREAEIARQKQREGEAG